MKNGVNVRWSKWINIQTVFLCGNYHQDEF